MPSTVRYELVRLTAAFAAFCLPGTRGVINDNDADDDDNDAEAAVEAHMLIAAAGAVDGDRADGRPAANGS